MTALSMDASAKVILQKFLTATWYCCRILKFICRGKPIPGKYHCLRIMEARKQKTYSDENGEWCTDDTGEVRIIHPHKKHEVAQRLALLALTRVYGQTGFAAEAPQFPFTHFIKATGSAYGAKRSNIRSQYAMLLKISLTEAV